MTRFNRAQKLVSNIVAEAQEAKGKVLEGKIRQPGEEGAGGEGKCVSPFTDFKPYYEQNLRIYNNKKNNYSVNYIVISIICIIILFLLGKIIKCF